MAITNLELIKSGRSQFQAVFDNVIIYEASWDPAQVNSNSFVSEDITIPGAKLEDIVLVSYGGDLQNISLEAHVKAADTVNLHLTNNTAGAVDLAENQIHLIILRPYHIHK